MASWDAFRSIKASSKQAASQTIGLPDLTFLELRPRKARAACKFNSVQIGRQTPQDQAHQATVSHCGASSPTPASLLSTTNMNKNNITHLEALQQAKLWFEGARKRLVDRLALADEVGESLSVLVNHLTRLQDLQAAQQLGEKCYGTGQESHHQDYKTRGLAEDQIPGEPAGGMARSGGEIGYLSDLEPAAAEIRAEEAIARVRVLHAKWMAGGRLRV